MKHLRKWQQVTKPSTRPFDLGFCRNFQTKNLPYPLANPSSFDSTVCRKPETYCNMWPSYLTLAEGLYNPVVSDRRVFPLQLQFCAKITPPCSISHTVWHRIDKDLCCASICISCFCGSMIHVGTINYFYELYFYNFMDVSSSFPRCRFTVQSCTLYTATSSYSTLVNIWYAATLVCNVHKMAVGSLIWMALVTIHFHVLMQH